MPYVYPFNSNIQFWELPPIAKDGRYKKDKFLKEINAERYDMVLMLTANRYRKRVNKSSKVDFVDMMTQ